MQPLNFDHLAPKTISSSDGVLKFAYSRLLHFPRSQRLNHKI